MNDSGSSPAPAPRRRFTVSEIVGTLVALVVAGALAWTALNERRKRDEFIRKRNEGYGDYVTAPRRARDAELLKARRMAEDFLVLLREGRYQEASAQMVKDRRWTKEALAAFVEKQQGFREPGKLSISTWVDYTEMNAKNARMTSTHGTLSLPFLETVDLEMPSESTKSGAKAVVINMKATFDGFDITGIGEAEIIRAK